MWWISRRKFFRSAAGAFAAFLVPHGLWARFRPAPLDPVRLGAVADAVLPSPLGDGGKEGVVRGFLGWLEGYRPGAELSHGYGSGSMEIRHLPPDPTPRWEAQLDHLDLVARQRFGSDFYEVPREARRLVLRDELVNEASGGISAPAQSDHVAAALMAFAQYPVTSSPVNALLSAPMASS